ncbi:MAG: LEA type 2 family protein [Phycisphaeraceae bacterium]
MSRWFVGMLGLLACVGGCQTVAAPEAEVQSVAVTQQTDDGARVEVLLSVHNPNDFALPVRSAGYTVRLAETSRFAFTDEPAVTLPPNASQVLVLAAGFAADDAIADAAGVRVTGHLRYQPPGDLRELLTEYHFPLPHIRFGERTTVEHLADD